MASKQLECLKKEKRRCLGLTCARPGPGEKEKGEDQALLSSYSGYVSSSRYDTAGTPKQGILQKTGRFYFDGPVQ